MPKYKIRNPLKYSELFCGPGGMSLGAKLASSKHPKLNIEHLWATDYDENACRTYAHNFFGSEIYVIYNRTSDNINAQSNYWESNIFSSLAQKVYDFNDLATFKSLVFKLLVILFPLLYSLSNCIRTIFICINNS